jgi:hypothetical protein
MTVAGSVHDDGRFKEEFPLPEGQGQEHTHQAKVNILFLLTFPSILWLSPPEIQRAKLSKLCPQLRGTRHTHGGDHDDRDDEDDESSRQEFFWEER